MEKRNLSAENRLLSFYWHQLKGRKKCFCKERKHTQDHVILAYTTLTYNLLLPRVCMWGEPIPYVPPKKTQPLNTLFRGRIKSLPCCPGSEGVWKESMKPQCLKNLTAKPKAASLWMHSLFYRLQRNHFKKCGRRSTA